MGRKNTNIFIDFDFDENSYLYEVPFEQVMSGIRYYFYAVHNVKVDGTDTAVWNMCASLNLMGDIEDSDEFKDFIKEQYEDYAREEYEEEQEFDREFDRHFGDKDTNESLKEDDNKRKYYVVISPSDSWRNEEDVEHICKEYDMEHEFITNKKGQKQNKFYSDSFNKLDKFLYGYFIRSAAEKYSSRIKEVQ